MEEYSVDEKYENFVKVYKYIHELRRDGVVNPKHIEFFIHIRKAYPNLAILNEDVSDEVFRKRAFELEQIARYLVMYLKEHNTLEPVSYVRFLQRICSVFEFLFPAEDVALALLDVMSI